MDASAFKSGVVRSSRFLDGAAHDAIPSSSSGFTTLAGETRLTSPLPGLRMLPPGWPRLLANAVGLIGLSLGISGCDTQSLYKPSALLSLIGGSIQPWSAGSLIGAMLNYGYELPFGATAWVSGSQPFPWSNQGGQLQWWRPSFGQNGYPGVAGYQVSSIVPTYGSTAYLSGASSGSFSTMTVDYSGGPSTISTIHQPPLSSVPAPLPAAGLALGLGWSRKLRCRVKRSHPRR